MIEHKGDVFEGDFTEYEGFDAVIGGSPCFVAGTMVFTSDGQKPIEDVRVGETEGAWEVRLVCTRCRAKTDNRTSNQGCGGRQDEGQNSPENII